MPDQTPVADATKYQLPHEDLHAAVGDLKPGQVVGIVGKSGTGKSLLAMNLLRGFMLRGFAPLVLTTDSGPIAYLSRFAACGAGVSAWRAEKVNWRGAEAERERFLDAIAAADGLRVARVWDGVVQARTHPEDCDDEEPGKFLSALAQQLTVPLVVLIDHAISATATGTSDEVAALIRSVRDAVPGGLVLAVLAARKPTTATGGPPPTLLPGPVADELDVWLDVTRGVGATPRMVVTVFESPNAPHSMDGIVSLGLNPETGVVNGFPLFPLENEPANT